VVGVVAWEVLVSEVELRGGCACDSEREDAYRVWIPVVSNVHRIVDAGAGADSFLISHAGNLGDTGTGLNS